MKKIASIAAMLIVLPALSFATNADSVFTGEITDSACAKMGDHLPGYKTTGTRTPKSCISACVRAGAKIVLYDPSTKTVYFLDKQDKAANLAGEHVKIEGTLDAATKTIHVHTIETTAY